jgi:hypothetical protein
LADFYVSLGANAQLHLQAYEASYDTPSNTSVVQANVWLERTAGTGRYSSYTNNSWSDNIDGQGASGSGTYDLRGGGSQLLLSNSFTIAHNSDGTRSISVSAAFSDPHANIGSGTASGTLVLTTIPRYPDAPTFNSIDQITAVGARANFTAPANTGGSAITGYTVRTSTDPAFGSGVVSTSGASSPITFGGSLTPSTMYYAQVLATNTQGNSPWSASQSFTSAAAGAPHLAVFPKWDGSGFFLALTPPFSVGSVTSYSITRTVSGPGAPPATTIVTTTNTGNFDPLVLAAGQSVTYQATALVGGTNTGPSASATFAYAATIPGAPFYPMYDAATTLPAPFASSQNAASEWANLCTNPSAETNITGWTVIPGTGGTATTVQGAPISTTPYGTQVIKTAWTVASTAAGGGAHFVTAVGSVTPGLLYSVAVGLVKANVIQRLQLSVDWYTAAAVFISSSLGTQTVFAANTAQTLSIGGVTAPATASYADIKVLSVAGTSYANWANGNILELDGAWLAQVPTVTSNAFMDQLVGPVAIFGRHPEGWRTFAEGLAGAGIAGSGTVTQVDQSLGLGTGATTGTFDVMAVSGQIRVAAGLRVGTAVTGGLTGLQAAVFATINYFATITVVSDTITRMAAEIEWYASNGSLISRSQGTQAVLVAGAVTELQVNGTAPAGAVYAAVNTVDVAGTSWSGAEHLRFVGKAMLSATARYPYFDGASPADSSYSYSWTAAANASASLRTTAVSGTTLQDPLNPIIPSPPQAPTIAESSVSPSIVWRRYVASVAASAIFQWTQQVPTVALFASVLAERSVRVRFYENPNNLSPTIWTDGGAAPLSEMIVSYIPPVATFTIDGVSERAWVTYQANPTVQVPADHLLFGTNGGPVIWPGLACGVGLIMTIDVPTTATPNNIVPVLSLTERLL